MTYFKSAIAILIILLGAEVSWGAEPPDQKIGLWQTTSVTTGDGAKSTAPEKSQNCVTAEDLAEAKEIMAQMRKSCKKYDTRQAGNTWITESTCSSGATTITMHITLRRDSDNAFHSESDATYSPPLRNGRAHNHTVDDSVYMGACSEK